jgi:hypothetical protein
VATTAFVFVTFLLRATYSAMTAVSDLLQDNRNACLSSNECDSKCYNVYYLVRTWLIFTPEFQIVVVLISSPLALLVALWGMTSKRALNLMNGQQQRQLLRKQQQQSLLLPVI